MEHPFSQFKYCPKCGSVHFEINNEKSKRCANCEFVCRHRGTDNE